ncbi:P-loop containing nucleoside triphosphate hydrolase protein [Serendipita vermifera]|nr:P-loop containing nucleoside triphosphate hydrolase protein [Serendipita vermifera]
MSDYDEYFDSLDDDALAEVNALEASHTARQQTSTNRTESTKDASNALILSDTESELEFEEVSMNIEDMKQLEEAASKRVKQLGPPRWIAPVHNLSTSRQTNLFGEVLDNQPQPQPSQHRPTFGQKLRKTKVWDKTAFAKTGWRSTKPPKGRKGKGKAGDDEMNEDEYVDLEGLPEPFMPLEPIKTMKLKPDKLAMKEWIFPLNNPKRDYQYNIVQHSLFENCLVAIPTGVGKTFIAGCVMLNYYRWFPEGKIIFVAPTKPLVAQQIEACHHSCGIPGTDAIELTGQIPREMRAIHWRNKRVFYMTPQTLVNDLATSTCDPTSIALLVVDEAHKGTGDYAYAQIVRFMMAVNPFFRILALTATPASKPEAVQAIVDSLHISHIEIRNEGSMDVQPYMRKKVTSHHVIEIEGELKKILDPFIKLIETHMRPLVNAGILWPVAPHKLKDFICTSKMRDLEPAQKWAYGSLSTMGKLARALTYFLEYSVTMGYRALKEVTEGGKQQAKKPTLSKGDSKVSKDPNYIATIQEMERQRDILRNRFPAHPKMDKLRTIAIQHFARAELEEEGKNTSDSGSSSTKMIVFCTFRDCIEEIVEILNEQNPMIRAHRFIGQGTNARGKGVSQKEQIEIIKRFKEGEYNVLVSTSIGEEGLDIGEVDVIVCYDVSSAAIRLIQRIGRTGRKKDGRVEALVTKDREENNWAKAQDTYKVVQQTIVRGTDLELFGDVERLLPENVQPKCIEMVMEIIPYEREERKRGSSKQNVGRSGNANIKDALMKRSRVVEDDLEAGSPVKKKAKKFVDSESEEEIPPIKKALTKSKSLVSNQPSGSAGFSSARSVLSKVQHEEDERPFNPRTAFKLPAPQKSSSSSNSSGSKPKAAEIRPPRINPMSWLVDSDSDTPLNTRTGNKQQDTVIELTESEEDESDVDLAKVRAVPSHSEKVKSQDYESVHRTTSSPDSSFIVPPVRRRRQLANVDDFSATQDLTSQPARRLKRKNDVADEALMPPPPLPNSSQSEVISPRPRPSKQIQRSKVQKPSILDGNILLEMEAIHSGDEVDAGSSDSEGEENSSDREFVVDASATQIDTDYDQSAVYRQGLFTQAPAGGPQFISAPVRNGYLGRGKGNSLRRDNFSSSPSRGDELDTYSLGSFVVDDDDEILEESSE